jgi:hypothetical protein
LYGLGERKGDFQIFFSFMLFWSLQVESVMEQNFLQDKEGVFPLRPDLLSSLGEEELILTEALVGLSGLEVQRSGPQYMWDPDTLPRLCALYAGLSLFQLLTKAS